MSEYTTELLIVGYGPAGHAASLAARECGIGDIIVADPAPDEALGATGLHGLRQDRVISNSAGQDFLEPYGAHPDLTDRFATQFLETPESVALHERVAQLLGHAARRQIERGDVRHISSSVGAIALAADGFVARTVVGETIKANELVLATGGYEELLPELAARDSERTFTSHEVLVGQRDDALSASLDASSRVSIIGNAHSGYSIAAWLRRDYPEHTIDIVQRAPCKPFFGSTAEAERYGYAVTDVDTICSETGKINRFGGIRGVAREAWIRQHDATNPDTQLRDVRYGREIESLRDIDPDHTVIQAVGYTPVLPQLDSPTVLSQHEDGYGLITFARDRQALVLGVCGSSQHGTAVYHQQAQKYFTSAATTALVAT
jgi:thioredoxin reductase